MKEEDCFIVDGVFVEKDQELEFKIIDCLTPPDKIMIGPKINIENLLLPLNRDVIQVTHQPIAGDKLNPQRDPLSLGAKYLSDIDSESKIFLYP